MKHVSSFVSFLPLALCLALLPHLIVAQQPTSSPNLIAQVCDRSAHKDICIASLESDPKSQHADLFELALIALNLASSNASDTLAYVKQLLSAKSSDPAAEQYLIDCSEQYLDAIQQLDDSLAALLAKSYKDVYTWVKAAIADAESCEEEFKQGGQEPVLSHRNNMLRQLCNNAIAVTKALAGIF